MCIYVLFMVVDPVIFAVAFSNVDISLLKITVFCLAVVRFSGDFLWKVYGTLQTEEATW